MELTPKQQVRELMNKIFDAVNDLRSKDFDAEAVLEEDGSLVVWVDGFSFDELIETD